MSARRARTDHQEDVHRNFRIDGSAADLDQLWTLLATTPFDQWQRDEHAEGWYRKRGIHGDVEPMVFRFVGRGLPTASLWLFREATHVHVSNVVPIDTNRLTHAEYNGLVESFARECGAVMLPKVAGSLRPTLGPTIRTLEDLASPATISALRGFSACANKSTGNAHPLDNERWNDFVLSAHEDGERLDGLFLQQWLRSQGWDLDHASRLEQSYLDQLSILQHRAPAPRVVGEIADWHACLGRIRPMQAVLVVDTSALLDLIQLTERADPAAIAVVLRSATELLEQARSYVPRLAFGVCSAVEEELGRREDMVRQKAADDGAKAVRRLEASSLVAKILTANDSAPVGPSLDVVMRSVESLGELLARICNVGVRIPITKQIRDAAFQRSARGIPPASRGKDSIVDCAIAEAALHLARELPSSRTKVILLSSNKNDFDQPVLVEELHAAGVTYCKTWEHARHITKETRA